MGVLTQDELKSKLHYNPETGIFTWNISPVRPVKAGSIAGSVDGNGYILIGISCKRISAHRLAWLYAHGHFTTSDIDHINGVRNDNRLCNLREATRSQNLFNRSGANKNNTSGFKGVAFNKRSESFRAMIRINGKNTNLGYFNTPEEASEAYQTAARKYHGEFYSRRKNTAL